MMNIIHQLNGNISVRAKLAIKAITNNVTRIKPKITAKAPIDGPMMNLNQLGAMLNISTKFRSTG